MPEQIRIAANYEVGATPIEDIMYVDFNPDVASDIVLEYVPESQGGPIVRPKQPRI